VVVAEHCPNYSIRGPPFYLSGEAPTGRLLGARIVGHGQAEDEDPLSYTTAGASSGDDKRGDTPGI